MPRRFASILCWSLLALALVVVLLCSLGVSASDLVHAVAATPPSLIIVVAMLTIANQMIGVARWRTAAAWLRPDTAVPAYAEMFESTAIGSFFGQVLPPQLSLSLARWWRSPEASRNWVIGSTLYEQLFDFVVLSAGSAAGLTALVLGWSPTASAAGFTVTVIGACLAIRFGFSAGQTLAGTWARRSLPGHRLAVRLIEPLGRCAQAPSGLLAQLCGWSLARLVVLILRTVAIATVFIPHVHAVSVAIGYPVIGLAMAVPFLPAGLGLAEWTWSGLLVMAGAVAGQAAMVAVLFRIINLVALALVMVLILPLRLVRLNVTPMAAAVIKGGNHG